MDINRWFWPGGGVRKKNGVEYSIDTCNIISGKIKFWNLFLIDFALAGLSGPWAPKFATSRPRKFAITKFTNAKNVREKFEFGEQGLSLGWQKTFFFQIHSFAPNLIFLIAGHC
jgi:hypothetical protein